LSSSKKSVSLDVESNRQYYDWYNDRKQELGMALIRVLTVSMDTGDVYKIGDTIRQWIEELHLPHLQCGTCGKIMSFFDYHLMQGMCSDCAKRISNEIEKETYPDFKENDG